MLHFWHEADIPKILANVCLWCIYWHYCGRVASTADVPKPQFSPLNQWLPTGGASGKMEIE
jgi:hypothetical protein